MISCILCPIDGSDHSDKAINLACDLATRYKAKVCFLHVFMKNLSIDELMQFESNAHLKDLVAQESARISELMQVSVGMHTTPYIPPPDEAVVVKIGEVIVEDARRAAEQRGTEECSAIVVDGNAVDQILKHAEQLNADVIVMGHRGLGAFWTLLGGSVSNKVSQLAQCTCISVK